MKQSLFFSLKVYATAIALAPPFAAIISILMDLSKTHNNDELGVLMYIIGGGFFVFSPSWFLFGLATKLLTPGTSSVWITKLWLSPISIFLIALPLALINTEFITAPGELLPLLLCYSVILVIGVIVYPLPQKAD